MLQRLQALNRAISTYVRKSFPLKPRLNWRKQIWKITRLILPWWAAPMNVPIRAQNTCTAFSLKTANPWAKVAAGCALARQAAMHWGSDDGKGEYRGHTRNIVNGF